MTNLKERALKLQKEQAYEGTQDGLYFAELDLTIPLDSGLILELYKEITGAEKEVEDSEEILSLYSEYEGEIDRLAVERYFN